LYVLLVHGMGRTALSLYGLARDLQSAGHETSVLGYVAALEPFARIVGRIQARLARIAGYRRPYAVVGHSLGGLLVRAALARAPVDPLPLHLIMLGTPNRSPRLAQRYRHHWLYRWVNGESGQVLAQTEFFERLPRLAVPYTIIAGTKGWRSRPGVFGQEPNDGLVSVSETLVSSHDVPIELPVRHTFMMNNPGVRDVIRTVLKGAAG
jgi:hypothetical protein